MFQAFRYALFCTSKSHISVVLTSNPFEGVTAPFSMREIVSAIANFSDTLLWLLVDDYQHLIVVKHSLGWS